MSVLKVALKVVLLFLLHVSAATTENRLLFSFAPPNSLVPLRSSPCAAEPLQSRKPFGAIPSLRCELHSSVQLRQQALHKRWIGEDSPPSAGNCFCLSCSAFSVASKLSAVLDGSMQSTNAPGLPLWRLDLGVNSSSEGDSEDMPAKPRSNSTDPYADLDGLSTAMIRTLKGYKAIISPILPPSCRFLPTCSEYSMQAIREFGPAKGVLLTAWRLMRCNPVHWGKNGRGYDPPRWPPPPYGYHWP